MYLTALSPSVIMEPVSLKGSDLMKHSVTVPILALLLCAALLLSGCAIFSPNTPPVQSLRFTLEPAVDSYVEISDEELNEIADILCERMDTAGVPYYSITAEAGWHHIVAILSVSEIDDTTRGLLTQRYYLTFRDSNGEIVMDNSDVKSAEPYSTGDYLEAYGVTLTLTDEGCEKFSRFTGEHIGEVLSVYLDEDLMASPMINARITTSVVQIAGSYTEDEAEALCRKINTKALPFPLEITSEDHMAVS